MTGDGQPSGDRGDIHDGAAAALSHAGQYGLGHAQHAEVVRLEECLDPVDRHVLDRPAAADAGVVDEDVDAPGLVEDLGHAALDGAGVIDVQGDDPHGQALGVDRRAKVGGGGRLADAGPDVVALAAEVQGRGQADAGAGAGDQGDGHDASSGTEGDYYERGDTIYRMSDEAKPSNFIRDIILEHNRTGRFGGQVITRFPPEPNGYLHIGHAKAICLDFGLAREFGGHCNLRFDDTNPTKESQEYVDVDHARRPLARLRLGRRTSIYASDYFEQLYQWAEQLIQAGKAYVGDLSGRSDPRVPRHADRAGPDSPYRDRSVEENLDLFRRMRAGEFPDGARTLRAKIDMASPNLNMRDPVMYRIRKAAHHRTGDAWCIYPMYD